MHPTHIKDYSILSNVLEVEKRAYLARSRLYSIFVVQRERILKTRGVNGLNASRSPLRL